MTLASQLHLAPRLNVCRGITLLPVCASHGKLTGWPLHVYYFEISPCTIRVSAFQKLFDKLLTSQPKQVLRPKHHASFNCCFNISLSIMLKFKFQLLPRTEWLLCYRTFNTFRKACCTEMDSMWGTEGPYSAQRPRKETYTKTKVYVSNKLTNKMQTVSKVYYLTFMCGLTCFGRFLAHHQELTTELAASGFTVGAWR